MVPSKSKSPRDSNVSWGVVLFLIFAVVLVVFVVQNMGNVPITFLSWEGSIPLPLVVALTALLAIIADEIVGTLRRRRRRIRRADKDELERYRSN